MKYFLICFFFTLVLIKIFESFFPLANGDPFYYHLVFPIKLFEIGWKQTHIKLCGALQTGLMEYLYIIPYLFLKNNLIKFQQVSQFLHFSLGLLAGSLFTFYKLKNRNFSIAIIASISLLTISKSADFFLLAKNDGIIPFLTLVASYYITYYEYEKNWSKHDWIIAIAFFLIPLIKLNGLIVLIILDLYWAVINYNHIKKTIIMALVQLFAIGLIIWRNWYFIKSPFFPGMLNVFPGEASWEMIKTYTQFMSNPLSTISLQENLFNFFLGKYIFLISIPMLFINLFFNKTKSNIFFYLAFSMFAIYLKINGGITTERLYFYCYFLLNFFIFHSLTEYNLSNFVKVLLLLFALIDSKVDKSIGRVFKLFQQEKLNSKEYVNLISKRNTVWDFIPPAKDKDETLIISDAWNEIFYSPLKVQLDCTECSKNAAFLAECKSTIDINQLTKYDYAILSKKNNNPCYEYIKSNKKLVGKIENFEFYKI